MQAFTSITAVAAAVPIANIDTDALVPAAFLKTTSRQGLKQALFAAQRTDPDFPLNRQPWDKAGILVALDNFGCGSSREHAPWALLDFGIRCVIAPSFADIFRGNCFKNGILPVELEQSLVEILLADATDPATARMTVDLEREEIVRSNGESIRFVIEPQKRRRLLAGVDDIAMTLQFDRSITRHENNARTATPWVMPIPQTLP